MTEFTAKAKVTTWRFDIEKVHVAISNKHTIAVIVLSTLPYSTTEQSYISFSIEVMNYD